MKRRLPTVIKTRETLLAAIQKSVLGWQAVEPPANEPQCWENTIHNILKYNTIYSWKHRGNRCLPFCHIAHEDKGNRRNVPSSIKACEGTCLTFMCRNLHGFLAESASCRTHRGNEHYFKWTQVQRDLMAKMSHVITGLHCKANITREGKVWRSPETDKLCREHRHCPAIPEQLQTLPEMYSFTSRPQTFLFGKHPHAGHKTESILSDSRCKHQWWAWSNPYEQPELVQLIDHSLGTSAEELLTLNTTLQLLFKHTKYNHNIKQSDCID